VVAVPAVQLQLGVVPAAPVTIRVSPSPATVALWLRFSYSCVQAGVTVSTVIADWFAASVATAASSTSLAASADVAPVETAAVAVFRLAV
jgi:hypothetical protein